MRTSIFPALLCAASFVMLRGATLNVRDFGAVADGQTNDVLAFQKAIAAAQEAGRGSTVFVPAGRYRLEPSSERNRTHLVLSKVTGITLAGTPDTVLIASDPTRAIISIEDSADVTVRGLQLDRHPLVFTQGRIDRVDVAKKQIEITIDDGYDEPDSKYIERLNAIMIFTEPATGTWDHDAPWPPAIESRTKVGPRQWRLGLSRARPEYAGKPFVIWRNMFRGAGFSMKNSRNITVEDVIYYGGGANAGFFINHCEGDIVFRRFGVTVPRGSGRLFSASGGAMVFNNRIRLLLDGCDFWGMDDDCLNMGTNSSHVLAQLNPRTTVIEGGRGNYRAGDTVAIWDWVAKKERTRATVEKADWQAEKRVWEITLDREVVVAKTGDNALSHIKNDDPPGVKSEKTIMAERAARRANEADGVDRVINMSDVGTAVIRNSRFHSYRARNLMIKASDTLVENNEFYDTTMASIIVGPEFYWDEGPAVHNLTIRNNTFRNISGTNILIEARTSAESYDLKNIRIEGNTFLGYGHYAMGVSGKQGSLVFARNTDGLVVENNRIGPADPAAPKVAPLITEVSRNVRESWKTSP